MRVFWTGEPVLDDVRRRSVKVYAPDYDHIFIKLLVIVALFAMKIALV
jgi:hypothetical protein